MSILVLILVILFISFIVAYRSLGDLDKPSSVIEIANKLHPDLQSKQSADILAGRLIRQPAKRRISGFFLFVNGEAIHYSDESSGVSSDSGKSSSFSSPLSSLEDGISELPPG